LLLTSSQQGWNDCKASLKEAGLWGTVSMSTLAFNAFFGPWDSGKFFNYAQEGAAEYMQHLSRDDGTDPLLQKIRAEFGQGTATGEDLCNAAAAKGPRVTLCRWFSWFPSAAFNIKRWGAMCAVLMYVGIELKYFKNPDEFRFLQDDATGGQKDADLTPGEEKEAIKELRKNTRNQLHAAAIIFGDPQLFRNVKLIFFVAGCLQTEHSEARQGSQGMFVQMFCCAMLCDISCIMPAMSCQTHAAP
jgi:hypothetical protein